MEATSVTSWSRREGGEGEVGTESKKGVRASSSPSGANGGCISTESGRKRGGETPIAGNGSRWSPEEGGYSWGGRCHAGAKRGETSLSAFCAEATHAPGRREGGSSAGVTHEGERGGVRHRRGAQRGRGSTEQKPGRGEDGGVWAAREVEERGWRACRRGPTEEGRELGRAREQQCRF
jgi:hypothetical protein